MTSNDLIAVFETLADAPDGVKRLRELVLQLAVRGKLVPQDPIDEPAATYLLRIRGERRKAFKGASREPSGVVPSALPAGWAVTTFDELGAFVGGKTPSKSNARYWDGSIPWVSPKDMKTTDIQGSEDHVTEAALGDGLAPVPVGAVLIVVRSGILRRTVPVAIARVRCTLNQDLKALCPCPSVKPEYIRLMVMGFERVILEQLTKVGTTVESMKFDEFAAQRFPLPPLAEQHRIVARVDELMGLLDRLEAARTTRDALRRAARDAALAALRDAEDTDAVEAAWGRIAAQMDALFAEPEDVGPLRQAVLGLAVSGRLVSPSAGDRQPVEIRVGEVVEMLNGFAFSSEWYLPTGVRLVRNQNVGHGTLDWTDAKKVSQDHADEFARFRLRAGDIVLSLDRPLISTGLKVAVVRDSDLPCLLLQRVCCPRPKDANLDRGFFFMWLRSPEFVEGIDPGRSNGVPHISTREVERMSIRLPGLAEQHRIVAKVDTLMALCDALEARLTAARDLHAQFAAAAVHHLDV